MTFVLAGAHKFVFGYTITQESIQLHFGWIGVFLFFGKPVIHDVKVIDDKAD